MTALLFSCAAAAVRLPGSFSSRLSGLRAAAPMCLAPNSHAAPASTARAGRTCYDDGAQGASMSADKIVACRLASFRPAPDMLYAQPYRECGAQMRSWLFCRCAELCRRLCSRGVGMVGNVPVRVVPRAKCDVSMVEIGKPRRVIDVPDREPVHVPQHVPEPSVPAPAPEKVPAS
jgi:hypothetical protein